MTTQSQRAASGVFNLGARANPTTAAEPAAAAPSAEYVQADYYLNPGIFVLVSGGEGQADVIDFVSVPKGLPMDTMEFNDGKTDAFAARNALLVGLRASPEYLNLKPGESVFLTPQIAGTMGLQLFRRKDKNAGPSGPTPLSAAISGLFAVTK